MKADKLDLTYKYMLVGIGICFGVCAVIGSIISLLIYPFEPALKYVLGLLLSTVFSVLRVFMMKSSVEKMSKKETEKSASTAYQLDFVLRQFLIIIFLVLAFLLKNYIGLIGVLIGMFFVKISGYIGNYLLSRYEKKHKA